MYTVILFLQYFNLIIINCTQGICFGISVQHIYMYIHIHLQIYNEYKNISSTSFHLEIIPYAEYRKILALVLFFPLSTLLPMSEFMTW